MWWLLLFVPLVSTDKARQCCPGDQILNVTSSTCEAPSPFPAQYTLQLVNATTKPAPLDWDLSNDTCLDIDNGKVIRVTSNESRMPVEAPHLRICCYYGQRYSSITKGCVPHNTSDDEFVSLFSTNIREQILLQVHGPLNECLYSKDNAIVDIRIHPREVYLDKSKSGFYIDLHPALSGVDKCLALESNSSLLVHACMPRSYACNSDRICIRRCCPEGTTYYGSVPKCRPKWLPLSMNFHESFDYDNLTSKMLDTSAYAISHGVSCGLVPVNRTINDWRALDNGMILRSNGQQMDYRQACFENIQIFGFPSGVTLFVCERKDPLDYIKATSFIISCIFLILTIFVYLVIPRLLNITGKTLIAFAFWMLVTYVINFFMRVKKLNHTTCLYLGYFYYFSFISANTWMNIRCFDIWWTLGRCKPSRSNKRFFKYAIYSTSFPIIITSLCLLFQFTLGFIPIDYKPNIAQDGNCFFSSRGYGQLIYYIIPLGLMISLNTLFFILTVRNFLKIRSEIEKMQESSKEGKKLSLYNDKAKFLTNAKLFTVMGIAWIFEVLSYKLYEEHWMWYLPDIANSLHGLLLFVVYVLKKKILKELKMFLCRIEKGKKEKSHNSNTISTQI